MATKLNSKEKATALPPKVNQLSNVLSDLPDFVYDFIRKAYDGDSINTQLSYALDIRIYLRFLMTLPEYRHIKRLEEFTPKDLEGVTYNMLLDFKAYLGCYDVTYPLKDGGTKTVTLTNGVDGVNRKIANIHSIYDYLFKADLIEKNIALKLDLSKKHVRMKKSLTAKDTMNFIDVFMNGENYFTEKKDLDGYKRSKLRNIALFLSFLGTGVRVSELLNLDIEHINFENSSFEIKRKGGKYQEIFMPVQVGNAIYDYLEERKNDPKLKDSKERALFISNRGTRLSVGAVEKIAKKYCDMAGIHHPDKRTIHAMRRTFACKLLEDGYDIRLIAELLGHADISVTAKFYASHSKETHKRVMSSLTLPTGKIESEDNNLGHMVEGAAQDIADKMIG